MRDGIHTDFAHIGFVWPDTGEALELFEMASSTSLSKVAGCPGLMYSMDYSHGPEGHSIEALKAVGESGRIVDAGRRLTVAGAQAIVWACTSGSFIGGLEWSVEQRNELCDRIGVPVTSGTLALISSSLRLGFESVDVLSSYPDDVSDILRNCIEDAGLTVTRMRALHSHGATDSAELPLLEECLRFSVDGNLGGDAVLIPDTAINSLELIPELELAMGRPVLTVNQACVFEGAALIGRTAALTELPAFHQFANCSDRRIL